MTQDRFPLDTSTLLKRARRAARALGDAAGLAPSSNSDLGECVTLRPVQAAAYANTIWQLAGRMEDAVRLEEIRGWAGELEAARNYLDIVINQGLKPEQRLIALGIDDTLKALKRDMGFPNEGLGKDG